jgi:hypothetical protein
MVLAATADPPRDFRIPIAIIAAGILTGVAIVRLPARP